MSIKFPNNALLILALSACTVTPTGGGGYRLSTVPISSMLEPSSAVSGGTPIAADSPGTAMNFAGPMDGGPGSVSLIPISGNEYKAHLYVASNAGVGDVTAIASRTGDLFMISSGQTGPSDQSWPCSIQMTLQQNQLQVAEQNCSYFHGMSVSFDGTLTRQ